MRRITVAVVALALITSVAIGVAVGRLAGGAAEQSPTFDTSRATGVAGTPTIAPLPTLPFVTASPVASPNASAVSGAHP